MAKQVKREDVDGISHLPDSIVCHVLSFLSKKAAVRTSILSSTWRYVFASLPNIDFHSNEFNHGRNTTGAESYWSFVDTMFSRNTTNLDNFRLKGGMEVDFNRFHGWTSAAFERVVKHVDLSIYFWPPRFTTLPCVLFTTCKLTTLKLDIGRFELDVQKGVHCPNLKTLHLKSVYFSNHDSVQSLLSGCARLEDMVLETCHVKNISNVNIVHHYLKRLTLVFPRFSFHLDTPNLTYFKYADDVLAEYSLENLQSLVKAEIYFFDYPYTHDDATALCEGMRNVRSLVLSPTSLKLLLSCDPLPVFANLVELKIYHYGGWQTFGDNGLETLLSNLPELVELDFPEGTLSSLPEEVPSCLLSKLRVIEISDFKDDEDCIEKAEYILENGGALEELIIRTDGLFYEVRSKIFELLLACPRKSKHCRIRHIGL